MPKRPLTKPRKKASQERSRATVEALVEATARILVRDGYDQTNTNKIADEAGISVGSLYQYFPNKEAIVATLLENHIDAMRMVVRTSLLRVADQSIADATRELVRVMLDAHQIEPKLHRVFAEQLSRVGSLDRLASVQNETIALVRSIFEARKAEIRVKNLDIAAWIVVTTVEALTHVAISGTHSGTYTEVAKRQELVEEITDVVVSYLALR